MNVNELKRYGPIAAMVAGLAAIMAMSSVDKLSIDPAKQAYAGAATSWCLALEPTETKPTPSPTPTPGSTCPSCGGSGKVGDGVVSRTCKECNGTGKVTDGDDDDTGAAPEDQGSSPGQVTVTPQQRPDTNDGGDALDCSDGSCGTVRTRRGIFGGLFRRR